MTSDAVETAAQLIHQLHRAGTANVCGECRDVARQVAEVLGRWPDQIALITAALTSHMTYVEKRDQHVIRLLDYLEAKKETLRADRNGLRTELLTTQQLLAHAERQRDEAEARLIAPAGPLVPLVPARDLKMLREALCGAQAALGYLHSRSQAETWSRRLQQLVAVIDKHRPLGSNGKHGDRHTPTCGCEDVPAKET